MVNCDTKDSPVKIQTPAHWNLIGPQYDCATVCVIAQWYSSTTLVSLRFHFCQEKIRLAFQTCYFIF
jgi:hypothetical protein